MKAYLVSADGKLPPSRPRGAWWGFVEHRLQVAVIYLMVAQSRWRRRRPPSRRRRSTIRILSR
jgi:hypothetical protein